MKDETAAEILGSSPWRYLDATDVDVLIAESTDVVEAVTNSLLARKGKHPKLGEFLLIQGRYNIVNATRADEEGFFMICDGHPDPDDITRGYAGRDRYLAGSAFYLNASAFGTHADLGRYAMEKIFAEVEAREAMEVRAERPSWIKACSEAIKTGEGVAQ